MKDTHVDNIFTIDKNTKIQIYFEQVFYMTYLWMNMILQIYMRITIICRILSILQNTFVHTLLLKIFELKFPLYNKYNADIYYKITVHIPSVIHNCFSIHRSFFLNWFYSY